MRRLLLTLMVATPVLARAQDSEVSPRVDTTSVWLSVGLGPATSAHSGLVGGDIALWGFRNQLGLLLRRSGGSDLDIRDLYDTGLLLAYRSHPRAAAIAAAVGPVVLTDDSVNQPRLTEPGVGFALNASVNALYVGIGVDGFASASQHRRIAGVGLSVSLGKIR